MTARHDVVVVGAGMVGAALAAALGEAGLAVAVVEAGAAPPAKGPGFDNRVSALSRASENLLRRLGAWPAIEAGGIAPYAAMEVTDSATGARIRFDAADIGEPSLGCIVENRTVVAALEERLDALDGVTWLRPRRVLGLGTREDGLRRVLLDEGELAARLVVGADGARSRVRQLAGIADGAADYGHHALVANVRLERPHGAVARQWFLAGGPLALLPLPEPHTCSIVWSTDPDEAAELERLEQPEFLERLGAATGHDLGRPLTVSGRAVFPLVRRHAERYVAPGLALVGDAAHTIHPLAGQGVNLGLLDAAALAEVLMEAHTGGRELGAEATLRRYERRRRGHNLAVQAAMSGFKQVFGVSALPLRSLRGLGVTLVDRLTPLKDTLIRQAMGLDGDIPRLCRGADAGDPA